MDYILFTYTLILEAKNLPNPMQDGVDQLPETREEFMHDDDVGGGVVQGLPLEGSINLTLSADD